MEATFPLFFAAVVGFGHAFEADHLIAVSNIVTKRDRPLLAIKDGIFWGLGHTSTIIIIGLIMIVGKSTILNGYFGYLEAVVGVMLIILGLYRLGQIRRRSENQLVTDPEDNHHLAYGVGLVHGLAGSGALVLLVMTEIDQVSWSLVYLLIFGLGSIIGMLLAAGIFSLPFSKQITQNNYLQIGLIIFSSILCIGYGGYVVWENLV